MRGRWTLVLTIAVLMAGCAKPADESQPPFASPSQLNPFLVSGPLRVQVDHPPGRGPSQLAVDALETTMRLVGSEPRFEVRASLGVGHENLTRDEVVLLHRQLYDGDPSTWRDAEGTPVLHVLYLAGGDQDQEGTNVTYGIAFANRPLIAMFPDSFPSRALPRTNVGVPGDGREGFERAILVHEYGHKLGLVGCGLPEVEKHADPDNPCHSAMSSSVMWPSPHASEEPLRWVLDDDLQPVWRFDDADWADIRAFQESIGGEPRSVPASARVAAPGVDFKSRRAT